MFSIMAFSPGKGSLVRMWRDLRLYGKALLRHWYSLAIGPASLGLTLLGTRGHVTLGSAIAVLLVGVPVAGFLAWREEHHKVKPDDSILGLRRIAFQEQLRKLDAAAQLILLRLKPQNLLLCGNHTNLPAQRLKSGSRSGRN
jgi:hypothetical protein